MSRELHWLAFLGCVASACSGSEASHEGGTQGTADRPSPEVEAVAVLAEARGDVRHRAAGTGTWMAARPRQALRPADLVQTMADAQATVRFVRGAAIELDSDTTLQIPRQPPTARRLEHLSGRLVARVSGDDERPTEVALPPGMLVLDPRDAEGGQSLVAQLDVDERRTRIDLVEGRGVLRRNRGDELEVANASYVSLDERGTVLEEGALGPPVSPLEPADGATVRVRRRVELSWEPHPDTDLYRVRLEPEDGEPTIAEVNDTRLGLQLPSGTYRWTVRAYRGERGYPRSAPRSFSLEVDREPPPLSLSSPEAGMTVDGDRVVVAGRTEPGARVAIDGHPTQVRADGSFRASHPVPRGLANVVVRAVDDVGNQRVVSRSVVRP